MIYFPEPHSQVWLLHLGNAMSGSVEALFGKNAHAPLYPQVALVPMELPGCLGVLRTRCSCWSSLTGALGQWQWHCQDSVPCTAQLLPVSWPATHAALDWHPCGSKRLLRTLLYYTLKGSLPALRMLSASEKQMHSWESTQTDMHLFPQPGPMDVSGPIEVTRWFCLERAWGPKTWGTTSIHLLEMSILLAVCQC